MYIKGSLLNQSCFLHQNEEVLARGGSSDIADTDTDRSIPEELSAQWEGKREDSSGDQHARYKYFFIIFNISCDYAIKLINRAFHSF
jgi:hypothetical protein